MLDRIESFVEKVTKLEYVVTVLMFLTMLSLMFIQVISRYVLQIPLGWSEEVLRYMFIGATFIGAGIATKERSHIEINFVEIFIDKKYSSLKSKLRAALFVNILRDIATAGFVGFISIETLKLVIDTKAMGSLSTAVQIPMWIVMSLMLAGFILCVFHSLALIYLNCNGRGANGYEFGGDDTTCSL